MSSISMSKLKSYLPFSSKDNISYRNNKSKRIYDNLLPEIGFQISLDPGSAYDSRRNSSFTADDRSHRVSEVIVRVIGARHLPAKFGLKSVEGYIVKVKLFPGSVRYDSGLQTSTWPMFNETFKFPLEPTTKSSFKTKQRKINASQSPPENIFRGHFVVLTVFALLELPPGSIPTIREKIKRFRRKSLLNSTTEKGTENVESADANDSKKDILSLTTSETRRNLGSVTYFLDPKQFQENLKTKNYATEELWLPIKDIAPTPASTSSLITSSNTSSKGQVEICLQLANETDCITTDDTETTVKTTESPMNAKKNRWSEMKKFLNVTNRKDTHKGLCLKITTSKMRCSIKVKEEYENVGNTIYVKTTVFEHDILSSSWKSDPFPPTLSTRWSADDSTIVIPIEREDALDYVSIKVSVATKTQMGKKIVFGVVNIGPKINPEHWQKFIANRTNGITEWHSFE